jgi:hypothetical protein
MKCPSCSKVISTAKCHAIQTQTAGFDGYSIRGVAFSCPLCQAILSVQADPFATNADLVAQIKKLLK